MLGHKKDKTRREAVYRDHVMRCSRHCAATLNIIVVVNWGLPESLAFQHS